jgi:proteasome lid subunit RPN8/RPN11
MSNTSPDIAQLEKRDLPAGKFPGETKTPFRVFIDPRAHKQIHAHASEDTSVEICGVLVGRWGRDEKGPFLSVTASIRGEAATNKFAEVTFTHDTWSKINKRMDQDFVGESIVGWYHTHPDFGIFLSERDRFIHEHFFSEPGQVALVVDPIRKEEGVFIWSAGKPVPTSHYWVGGDIRVPQVQDGEAKEMKRGGSVGAATAKRESKGSAATEERYQGPPSIGNWTLALGALCMLLLGWIMHDRLASGHVQAVINAMQLERLRLNRDIAETGMLLERAAEPLNSLSLQNRSPEVQSALANASIGFRATADKLSTIQRRYALDPNEITSLITALSVQQEQIDALRAKERATTAPAAGATTSPAATQPAGSKG